MNKELIPKHKNDFSTLEHLEYLNHQEFEKMGMPILEWLQDMNWPIAPAIQALVILKQECMIPHILTVLNGQNENWKYGIITHILPALTPQNLTSLLPKLHDMASNPTHSEIATDLHLAVSAFLNTETPAVRQ